MRLHAKCAQVKVASMVAPSGGIAAENASVVMYNINNAYVVARLVNVSNRNGKQQR